MTIMAEGNIIYRDLVHHQDYLVVMTGITMVHMRHMMVGIIGINHLIEIAHIAIDNTALTIKIGDITTRMVSPWLGTLIGIGMPMTHRNGYIKGVIRAKANLTIRLDIISQEIPGITAPQGLKDIKVNALINSQGTMLTTPMLVITDHLSMVTRLVTVDQTTTITHHFLPSLVS